MLLSLISVVVLLVIAFYAIWVGSVGRISGADGDELSVTGRAVVLAIAIAAFAGAYLIYRYQAVTPPAAATDARELETLPGTASATAERKVVAKSASAPVAAPEPVVPEADPAAPMAAETVDTTTEKAVDSSMTEAAAPADAASEGLSASAARLEAQKRLDHAAPVSASPAMTTRPSKMTLPVAAPAPAQRPAIPSLRNRGSRPRSAGSLLVHIDDSLGSDQSGEQLRLSIEGLHVAEFDLDQERPEVAVALPLPRPGLLHYRLEGVSDTATGIPLYGEGCILVRDGARFAVRRNEGSGKVFLEPQPARLSRRR